MREYTASELKAIETVANEINRQNTKEFIKASALSSKGFAYIAFYLFLIIITIPLVILALLAYFLGELYFVAITIFWLGVFISLVVPEVISIYNSMPISCRCCICIFRW
ncbi:hypothetical protein [Psittacicella hinzii]|uniref:Uncharacterized protein n=1 Tax=Psittacicella hinzii TaxID=2028575 RepID=A0A3A1YJY3_9GAMM|nr:hypothetical protein [Psittacicella hinzii]RIY37508.1 hypothetical protein CKF58_04880 [Psittacicella hinzii]